MTKVNKLYVGNMNFDTSEEDLRGYFEQNGITPTSVTVIKDRYTGKAKGFGFVEVNSQEDMQKAIQALNSKEFGGRTLTVNEAKPRKEGFDGGSGFRSRGNSRY